MSNKADTKMIITLVDGSQETYSFEKQMTDENHYMWMDQLHQRLEAKNLIIDLGSKIKILPMSNILKIEIEPKPPKLPPTCITGAVQG